MKIHIKPYLCAFQSLGVWMVDRKSNFTGHIVASGECRNKSVLNQLILDNNELAWKSGFASVEKSSL